MDRAMSSVSLMTRLLSWMTALAVSPAAAVARCNWLSSPRPSGWPDLQTLGIITICIWGILITSVLIMMGA
jgi:hypothetical protein